MDQKLIRVLDSGNLWDATRETSAPIYKLDVLTICSEGQTGRILLNGVATIGGAEAMTIKTCTDACRAAGYTLAGAEYGQECCKPYH